LPSGDKGGKRFGQWDIGQFEHLACWCYEPEGGEVFQSSLLTT